MRTITLLPGEELRIVSGSSSSGDETPTASLEGGARTKKSGSKTRKNRKGAQGQEGGKKRGANPFMKFAAKERKNIMSSNPGMPVTEVGKELGKRWRALSDAEKKAF